MNLNLKDKVAIVTGASKGIGAAIAKALAAEGVAVIVNYNNSKSDAEKVVSEIIDLGGKSLAIRADVSKQEDVKRMFSESYNHFGGLDIVINNAGIYKFFPVEAITENDFHEHFNINVLGPILTTQEALKYFPKSGGSIVNLSSGASINPGSFTSLYGSSKAAIDTLTLALAKELGARNIRVNVVAPGPTETEGVSSQGLFDKEEILASIINATSLGRLGQPDDIASVILFLVSDAAGWLTGVRIQASGGLF